MEENLKYNVELDDSVLEQQLQNIQGRIQSAISNGFSQSGGSPFAPQLFTPPTPDFSGQIPSNLFTQMQQFTTNAYQNFQTGFGMLPHSIGLYSSLHQATAAEIPVFNGGFMSNVTGMMGMGYDPSMPMYNQEYRFKHTQQVAESAGNLVSDSLVFGASTAAGFVTGGLTGLAGIGVGVLTGGAVALGTAAALDFVMEDEKERRKTTSALQQIGRNALGSYSYGQASDLYNTLDTHLSQFDVKYIDKVGMSDAQEFISQFAMQGGFDNTLNSQDLENKVMGVVENTRKISKLLGVFQDEAVKIMAELEQNQMVSADKAGLLAASLEAKGRVYGADPLELLQSSMSIGSELGKMGMSNQAGFEIGLDAASQMARLSHSSDPYTRQLIQNMGGVGGAATSMVNSAMQYGMGPWGTMMTAAYAQGGATGNIFSDVVNASNFYTPENYLTQMYMQPTMLENMLNKPGGMEEFALHKVNTAMSMVQAVGEKVHRGTVGAALQYQGLSRENAELTMEMITASADYNSEDVRNAWLAGKANENKTERLSPIGSLVAVGRFSLDQVGEFIKQIPIYNPTGGVSAYTLGDLGADLVESDRRATDQLLVTGANIQGQLYIPRADLSKLDEAGREKLIREKAVEYAERQKFVFDDKGMDGLVDILKTEYDTGDFVFASFKEGTDLNKALDLPGLEKEMERQKSFSAKTAGLARMLDKDNLPEFAKSMNMTQAQAANAVNDVFSDEKAMNRAQVVALDSIDKNISKALGFMEKKWEK